MGVENGLIGPQGPPGTSALPRINPTVAPYSIKNDGSADVTAELNAAAAAGAIDLPAGTYLVEGIVDIPGAGDFLGAGSGEVTFLLAAGGQLRVGAGGGDRGGRSGGFSINGQGVQNVQTNTGGYVAGGAYYVTGRNGITHQDIYVYNTVHECCRVDGGQNHDWIDCTFGNSTDSARIEVPLIFDRGTGGHDFYGCELEGGFRIQQTDPNWTGASGGYPAWLGPSDIHFHGGRGEYPTASKPLVYLAAGSDISLRGYGNAGTGSLIVMEPGAQNHPASSAQITGWDGSFTITVAALAAGVSALMSANVPNCPPETIVNSISGNTVTLSVAPTSDPTGGTAKFGARALSLSIYGPNGITGDNTGSAFDLRGGASVTLSGRPLIQNHVNAYLMRHSDNVYLAGAMPNYQNVTNVAPQQQAGDTGTFNPDLRLQTVIDGMLQVVTRSAPHRTTFQRVGDANPHAVLTPGSLALSDSTSYPQNAAISYLKDTIGEWLSIAGTCKGLDAPTLRVAGLGGFSTALRCLGQFAFVGHPTTGTHYAGEWGIDQNGTLWACVVGDGTGLGTWIAPAGGYSTQILNTNRAVTIDASKGQAQDVILQANATSSAITNAVTGARLTLRWVQDSSGGRTYVWPANWAWARGSAPGAVSAANNWQVSTAVYDGANWNEISTPHTRTIADVPQGIIDAQLPWTIVHDPILGAADAAVKVGTWAPSVDTAATGNGYLQNSTNAQNDEIGWDFTLAAGTYTIALAYRMSSAYAIFSIMLDGVSVGTIDPYRATSLENQSSAVSAINVATTGKHRISVKAATRNASSTGWFLPFQKMQIRRTA